VNETLVFIVGLVCGWLLSLLSGNYLREKAEKQDFQSQLKTYDTIFEQYLDMLTEKQEEIRQEIQTWVANARKQPRQLEDDFRINEAKAGEVLELVRQGYNTVEIAEKLRLGVGEVELIKQLKNSEITH